MGCISSFIYPVPPTTYRGSGNRQCKTPGPLWAVNWWMCLSKTPPLMLLSGFPKESLIHCWFDLLLCCVSASEQCVKTGYLPCSVGEAENWAASRRPGQTPCCHKSTKSQSTARLFSFCPPFLSLYLSFFISKAFFLHPFCSISPLCFSPCAPVVPWPPFLCLTLCQHNVYLRSEAETCFIWLPSFMTYKRTADTLVWSLFHAE